MSDMLVNLTVLDKFAVNLPDLSKEKIVVRRVMSYERTHLLRFIKEHFGTGWESEVQTAFAFHPATCFIATFEGKIVGFAAYECTCRNFFGPTGVDPVFRKRGIGQVLLFKCMQAMRELGYGYAIIGGAGPQEFYRRGVGAVPIDNSEPGVYTDWLKPLE